MILCYKDNVQSVRKVSLNSVGNFDVKEPVIIRYAVLSNFHITAIINLVFLKFKTVFGKCINNF